MREPGKQGETDCYDVFLSYSRNDLQAAASLHAQLRQGGLSVFKDDDSIRAGDLWLDRLQAAIAACGSFVVLVGRDGVGRWIGAETQAALNRHFGPQEDAERLPIFPILLGELHPETLPAFLQLFQLTSWNGSAPLPDELLHQIRQRTIIAGKTAVFEGCPFIGLAAYRIEQAHLFFGRQIETLDALACFDTRPGHAAVRWLEINGNSGSGKSSLMQAGLLPLVNQGWLWPRTGHERWISIGPMVPGAQPVRMLAEVLARAFRCLEPGLEMTDIRKRLGVDASALADWLRTRKQDGTAFLLAVDQFEELFIFADPDERRRFDCLLSNALADPDCPLFVLSTVRADFMDRFGEDVPQLSHVLNHAGKRWTLAPITAEGLREVIDGPARLADIDVSEVRDWILAEAWDEPGALPLVENALHWLWEHREGNRLSGRLFNEQGGLAGILSRSADDLLDSLGEPQRTRALQLLFRLVRVDREGSRHARQRIGLDEAVRVAGGGEAGRAVVNRLSGQRRRDSGGGEGPLRLITITEEGRSINLIHETLIRSKGMDAARKPQPYWPTLWTYIEKNKEQAPRRERLQLLAREWKDRKRLDRLFGLAGWSALIEYRGLAAPGSIEHHYLRWSRRRAVAEAIVLATVLILGGKIVYWTMVRQLPLEVLTERWVYKLGIEKWPLPVLEEIPAGSFMMGSTAPRIEPRVIEQPIHRVTFTQRFYLGKTEVTFREWDACVADGACYWPPEQKWGRGDRPVIHVSWEDVQVYFKWLSQKTGTNCRLPSEAEWEYAARAGTTTKYGLPSPDGSDDIRGKGLANCDGCGSEWDLRKTAPVGRFPPNSWGLHDMHGNVWEWVEDCLHENYANAPTDGRAWLEQNNGDCSYRMRRGGSWGSHWMRARSAHRLYLNNPGGRVDHLGFRVMCQSPSLEVAHSAAVIFLSPMLPLHLTIWRFFRRLIISDEAKLFLASS